MDKQQHCAKNREDVKKELEEGIQKVIKNLTYTGELDRKSLIPAENATYMTRILEEIDYQIGLYNNAVYAVAKIVEGKTDTEMDTKIKELIANAEKQKKKERKKMDEWQKEKDELDEMRRKRDFIFPPLSW